MSWFYAGVIWVLVDVDLVDFQPEDGGRRIQRRVEGRQHAAHQDRGKEAQGPQGHNLLGEGQTAGNPGIMAIMAYRAILPTATLLYWHRVAQGHTPPQRLYVLYTNYIDIWLRETMAQK